MSLKDELNQATGKALLSQRQKIAFDVIKRNEAEEMRRNMARQQAQRIIDTLKDRLFEAANNGKKSYTLSESDEFGNKPQVVKIRISYSTASNADILFTKQTLPVHLNNNVFDNNMQYYYIIEHVVTHLGLDCVLKFEHDGVGVDSWYELVINW